MADRFAAAGTTAWVVKDSGYEAALWSRLAMSYPVSTLTGAAVARMTLSICAQITPLIAATNAHPLNPARGRALCG